MSQPPRSSVRLMCILAAVNLTISGSLKDDEVEVVTLGALRPPLVSPVRPSGSRHAEARLDIEESPDETIARLLRHMFERERQQLLPGEELEDLSTETPPTPAPAAAAAAAAAADATTAKAQRPIRRDGSRVFLEEEAERHVPIGGDAAEVGQEPHNQQRQDEGEGGLGTSSTSGEDLPSRGLDGMDSESEDDAGRVEAGAAGVSNGVEVGRVEGHVGGDARDHIEGDSSEDEETSVGSFAAAASEGGDVPARDVLLGESEGSSVQGKARHARRQDALGAVAAGSGEDRVAHAMSLGQSSDGDLTAAVRDLGERGGENVAGPGASAEIEEDGSAAQEQEAAAAGVETAVRKEATTENGVEGCGTGSGDGRGTAARAVGPNIELGERVALEGELGVGAGSTLSHDTPPSVIPGEGAQHAAVAEEREEDKSMASTATVEDGAAAAAAAATETAAETAAEGTLVGEAEAMPDAQAVAEVGDSVDDALAPVPDIVAMEMDGATPGDVSLGEASSSLGYDGDEDKGAKKADAVPAAGVNLATVNTDGGGNNFEPGDEMGMFGSSGDSEAARELESPPTGGDGDDGAAGLGGEGEVGLGGRQSAPASASSESLPTEESRTDFRRPEEGRAAPAGDAIDDDAIVEPPDSSEPRRAAGPDELTAAPQAKGAVPTAQGDAVEEEGPPRPRPVFRFSEPLTSAPDVNLGLAGKPTADMLRDPENDGGVLGFPSLPPIDGLPGSGAKNGGARSDADAAGGGSGGGWWATWGGKLGAAARERVSRWASEAAGRGYVLANKLMEESIAQATKSWHETIEPQTEYARRRLEGVADFCMAEVADHLSDPVLAEAL